MNKYSYLFLLSFVLLCAGCLNSEVESTLSTLQITASDVEFTATGGEGTIAFSTDGTVSAASDRDWVTLSQPADGVLSFTVAANTGDMSRTAQIKLSTNGTSETVAITQMGAVLGVEDSYTVSSLSGTTEFDLYTNYDKTSVSAADSWATVRIEDQKLYVTAPMNTQGGSRTTTLTFTCGWKTATATLVQLSLTEIASVNLTQDGAAYTFTVSEEADALDPAWTVETDDSWLYASRNGNKVTVNADVNETGALRKSQVRIVAGDATVTLPVKQSAITDYYAYFQGAWTLECQDNTGTAMSIPVTLTADSDGTGYILSGLYVSIPLGYNSATHQLSFVSQYLGRLSPYYVYVCADLGANGYTWAEGAGMTLTFNGDEENSALIFSDNGSYQKTVSGITFAAFNGYPGTSSNLAGYFQRCMYITEMHR